MSVSTEPMPAKELCDLARDWLIVSYPDSIIVREMSVADWGGALIDIVAITPKHIVGVEIKGQGDSPTRLDRQGLAYGMVAKEMWLLPSPCLADRCWKKRPAGWGKLEIFDGRVRAFNTATRVIDKEPIKHGFRYISGRDDSRYNPHKAAVRGHLSPQAICGTLWRNELASIAGRMRLDVGRRATVSELTKVIEDKLTVTELHEQMIIELRNREWRKPVHDCRIGEKPKPAHGPLRYGPMDGWKSLTD